MFRYGRTPANQDDETRVRSVPRQTKEIVPIARDHHAPRSDGVTENLVIVASDWEGVPQDHHVMSVTQQRIRDRARDVVVDEELHISAAWV